jgi:uncharacterized protein DUF5666
MDESNASVESSDAQAPPSRTTSRGSVVFIAVAALVVGVLVGGVIGWQVEKQRVKDDVAAVRARERPVGTITAVSDDSLTIALNGGDGSRKFKLTDETAIETAEPTSEKLAQGATVLVRGRTKGSDVEAVEVIVLPRSDR